MIDANQMSLFDYSSLDDDTRTFVQEKAQAIQTRLKRTAEDIIAIGFDLIDVKAKLQYGLFVAWLQSEFEMNPRSAQRFMQVAEVFGARNDNLSFPISVLYELAAPSTSDTIIELVESGQIEPTIPAIREAKRELQEQLKPPAMPIQSYTPTLQPWQERASPPAIHRFEEEIDDDDFYEPPTISPDTRPMPSYIPAQMPEPIIPTKSPTLQALQSSESNEWFTPAQYVGAAHELMGGIDVDPASNAHANKIIQASTYYDIESNGLDKSWSGRVWLNPPYGRDIAGSNQEAWSRRLVEQYQAGITTEAILLVNANTEAKWFQPLYDYLICFTNHRIRFYTNDGTSSQPTQGNALVYFGVQQERFIEIFKQFGRIIKAVD